MALATHWYDFICFAIVGVAFLGALFLIWCREFSKSATPTRTCNRTTMDESLIMISKADESSSSRTANYYSSLLWKSCWRGLGPAWLLAFRFFSFAVLCVVLASDFREYGASIFVYYTEWTFALVIIYFVIATAVSARGCLLYYSAKAGNENGTQPGIMGYLMQVVYQTCAGAVVLTDIVFWCVIVPFLPNVHLKLNMLMGCMHTLNAVTLLIDTSINSLPFPWFRFAYFVLCSCCYIIFQWAIHACGFTWWPYPFLELSTPWAPLWYFCLAVIHIPCYGFYWLVVSATDSILQKLFPQSFSR